MITGLEHTAIASFDPHRLSKWYIQHLAFTLKLDTGKTVYIQSPNGVLLEFVYANVQPPEPHIRDAGLRHIAISVDQLESTFNELQSAGVKFADQPVILPGMRLHFFQDPDGNFLHLVEREVPFT
jgi:catechol 2,3-dioxygenase-like lactoylglutathione lyase family enzyme